MEYEISYSKEGNFRVSTPNEESDWLQVPVDGQTVIDFEEDGQDISVFVTLKTYDGVLEPNHVYPLTKGLKATVTENVEEEEEEEEEEDDDGEEGGEGDDEDDDDDDKTT